MSIKFAALKASDPEAYDVLDQLLVSASDERCGGIGYLDAYISLDLDSLDQVEPLIRQDAEAWQYTARFPVEPSSLDVTTWEGQFYLAMARVLVWVQENDDLDFEHEFYGHWSPAFCWPTDLHQPLSDEEVNRRSRQYLLAVNSIVFGRNSI